MAVALLALLVATIIGAHVEAGQRSADALAFVLAVPLTVPYAVHRRWPMPSVAVVLAAFLVFALLGYAAYPGLSVFVMLYGIAAHTDRRQSSITLALSLAAMIVGLTRQPAHVVTSADVTSSLLALGVAWLAGENLRSRQARWAALEDRARLLENEREEHDRRAVADERLRIARDLHDIVAHAMSVITVQAATGHHLLDRDPEAARRALANVETASRDALVEMRRMLGVLRDDDDEPGSRAPVAGLAGLDELVRHVRDAGLAVELDVDEPLPVLTPSLDLAAYRIVQEALTNVIKHGGPVARVALRGTATDVYIAVSDEGRPGPPTMPQSSTGHGLIGMRERVAAHDGDVRAVALSDRGFRVDVRLPLTGAGSRRAALAHGPLA